MKIICDKQNLATATKIAMRAVPSKAMNNIQECVLIETDGNGIELVSNNLEFGIMTFTDAEVIEPGRIAIEAKLFNDIVSKMRDGDISIAFDPENLHVEIKCGRSKFDIPTREAEMFTKLPETGKGETIKVDANAFCDAVARTIFCASEASGSALMTGEHIEVNGDVMRLIALDGFRVAVRSMRLAEQHPLVKATVPAKTLSEIAKIINADEVEIEISKLHAVFRFGDTIAMTRVIDGEYFDISKLLNIQPNTTVTVDKKRFIDSVERAKVLQQKDEKKALVITIGDSTVSMMMESAMGRTTDEVDAVKEGNDMRIGFNPRFLSDTASAIEDDDLTINLMNPKSPALINHPDSEYAYIILPVNIV